MCNRITGSILFETSGINVYVKSKVTVKEQKDMRINGCKRKNMSFQNTELFDSKVNEGAGKSVQE